MAEFFGHFSISITIFYPSYSSTSGTLPESLSSIITGGVPFTFDDGGTIDSSSLGESS